MLDDVWDFLGGVWEEFADGIREIPEVFSGAFEDMSDFSPMGLLYAIAFPAIVYLFRHKIFVALKSLPLQILVYFVSAVTGYFIGKGVWGN